VSAFLQEELHLILGILSDRLSIAPQTTWMDQTRNAIRDAFASARAGKAVSLDVDFCVLASPSTRFLGLLWSELSAAAGQGEMETCRRIATFVLTMPRSSGPPLPPLFLHILVPSLITAIDRQQPPEQTMNMELLVTIISSVLTASLHLEWALHSATGESRYVLGQSSAAMTRRFAATLRNRSPTSEAIAQRLMSSPSFVADFPTFMGELGLS
jgi:mediator of RNA polymerase II transcription subunit 5